MSKDNFPGLSRGSATPSSTPHIPFAPSQRDEILEIKLRIRGHFEIELAEYFLKVGNIFFQGFHTDIPAKEFVCKRKRNLEIHKITRILASLGII